MKEKHYPGYWTLERCKAECSKYKSRTEFQKACAGCYDAIRRNGWQAECFAHMDKLHNLYERCIYAITFPDKYAYVGLSCNMMRRFGNHLRGNSPVHAHMIATGLKPTVTMVHDYMPADEAKFIESEYIAKYQNDGYIMLNKKMNGGQMGAVEGGHSKKEVFAEIKKRKYKTLKEFREGSAGYYESAYRSDYWHEVRALLKVLYNPHHWTREEVLNLSRSCKTYREFASKHKRAYEWACRYAPDLIEEIKQFLPYRNVSKRISDEQIEQAIAQCETRSEFFYNFKSEYYAAYNRGYEYFEKLCAPLKDSLHKYKQRRFKVADIVELTDAQKRMRYNMKYDNHYIVFVDDVVVYYDADTKRSALQEKRAAKLGIEIKPYTDYGKTPPLHT